MIIKTSRTSLIQPFIKIIRFPESNSHKGQNGKILIIGGSSLFHAASLWAAEIASHFVDIVHYSSTIENEKVFLSLKKKFINGIIVPQKDLVDYIKEDDVVLIGPGMIRLNPKSQTLNFKQIQNSNLKFQNLIKIKNEGRYTYFLTKYIIENFPDKKFVFDAGALQMMDKKWLNKLKNIPIITPHQKEFERLFDISLANKKITEKMTIIKKIAKENKIVVLLKAIDDIISDGKKVYMVRGGNAGLTKGGTGDILAGLTASFYAKNEPLISAVLSSYLIKKTADVLFEEKGYWYNNNDIIQTIPKILKRLIFE